LTEIKSPRGTADILPVEQAYWEYVRKYAGDTCHLYGYQRIDTPVFEETALFIRGVGKETEVVQKQMYTFDDNSGTSITLRPEGTAPVCRAYLEHGMHNMPQPVKLFYISPAFRYERPQLGRFRQHWQFGVEAIGEADPSLDAEIIDMAWRFYQGLGLKELSIKLNSIGCQLCRPSFLEALKSYYTKHTDKLCPECKERLTRSPLRLLDCKKLSCRELAKSAPLSSDHLCDDCKNHFSQLQHYLELLDLPFELDPCLVRGLDYYTKTVFEFLPREEGAQSALGGGGRYDNLIEELGGKHTPAIGFATGIERIILNLKKADIAIPPLPTPRVYIAYLGEQAKEEALKLAAELRQNNISAITSLGSRSLKAQMRQANTSGTAMVITIGENELKNNTVELRDMVNAEQRTIPRDEILALLN